jgi:hypothetical protein
MQQLLAPKITTARCDASVLTLSAAIAGRIVWWLAASLF